VFFLKGHFNKGLYHGYKSKEYIIKGVIIAKKLPLNSFEDIKNNLGEI